MTSTMLTKKYLSKTKYKKNNKVVNMIIQTLVEDKLNVCLALLN